MLCLARRWKLLISEHPIEPYHPRLKLDALLDQLAQPRRQRAEIAGGLIAAACRKLDLALLLDCLLRGELALTHRPPDQEPRGELHQSRGEPHALGSIS